MQKPLNTIRGSLISSKKNEITEKDLSKDDSNDVHYKYTNKKQLNKLSTSRTSPRFLQEGVAQNRQTQSNIGSKGEGSKKKEQKNESSNEQSTILSTGLQHVTLKQLLDISSASFEKGNCQLSRAQ